LAIGRDLLILDVSVTIPNDDMTKNILEDTLIDLNQMDLEVSTSKVNPFKAIPYPKLTNANRLAIRDRFKDLIKCPKLKIDELGRLTKSTQHN